MQPQLQQMLENSTTAEPDCVSDGASHAAATKHLLELEMPAT